jgi:hypothetical protein
VGGRQPRLPLLRPVAKPSPGRLPHRLLVVVRIAGKRVPLVHQRLAVRGEELREPGFHLPRRRKRVAQGQT